MGKGQDAGLKPEVGFGSWCHTSYFPTQFHTGFFTLIQLPLIYGSITLIFPVFGFFLIAIFTR